MFTIFLAKWNLLHPGDPAILMRHLVPKFLKQVQAERDRNLNKPGSQRYTPDSALTRRFFHRRYDVQGHTAKSSWSASSIPPLVAARTLAAFRPDWSFVSAR